MVLEMIPEIPEVDVLIASCLWLHSQGWRIESISIARGQGINTYKDEQELRARLTEAQIPLDHILFTSSGPDIMAKNDSTTFKIECKGLGRGTPQTLRNNFDRTLASAVSYFDMRNGLFIGVAMPKDHTYVRLIKSKISQALREAINLWILLYDAKNRTIDSYAPNDGI